MARPLADEMVQLRRSNAFLQGKWKVTARYTVQVSAKKTMDCVRVAHYGSNSYMVRHFSEAEFNRLFKSIDGRRQRH